MFLQGKSNRTISLNTNYVMLFKNPRDNNNINILARQSNSWNVFKMPPKSLTDIS